MTVRKSSPMTAQEIINKQRKIPIEIVRIIAMFMIILV